MADVKALLLNGEEGEREEEEGEREEEEGEVAVSRKWRSDYSDRLVLFKQLRALVRERGKEITT